MGCRNQTFLSPLSFVLLHTLTRTISGRSRVYLVANIRVQGAPGTAWQIGPDYGQNFDGTMRGPGGFVRYQLYLDANNTKVWGSDDTSMAVATTDTAYDVGNCRYDRRHAVLPRSLAQRGRHAPVPVTPPC
ncbi:spore coat protein U domain-containing protein [Paraburkholderia monticola]|uniref:spore coat protein U domain-containing protein n=1 Tax=Paraburkholderia monticola TaxID=1399968 RepID=UPI001F4D1FB1|nr:spore coat protein U domain-containing protein [Paraburkholderia monticola]